MTDLDSAIRQAVSAEDAELMDRLAADPSLPKQVFNTFQGQFGWLNILGSIAALFMFAGGAYAAWRFATSPDIYDMLIWGALAAVAFAGLTLIKLWFWMELQRHAVVREIKRLELQVARLASHSAV